MRGLKGTDLPSVDLGRQLLRGRPPACGPRALPLSGSASRVCRLGAPVLPEVDLPRVDLGARAPSRPPVMHLGVSREPVDLKPCRHPGRPPECGLGAPPLPGPVSHARTCGTRASRSGLHRVDLGHDPPRGRRPASGLAVGALPVSTSETWTRQEEAPEALLLLCTSRPPGRRSRLRGRRRSRSPGVSFRPPGALHRPQTPYRAETQSVMGDPAPCASEPAAVAGPEPPDRMQRGRARMDPPPSFART